jgi:hypothetical protein
MAVIKVKSSLITAVDYDEETERLVVEFKGGGTYVYSKVPKEIYKDMLYSESIGKFFTSRIKGNDAFPFEKAE